MCTYAMTIFDNRSVEACADVTVEARDNSQQRGSLAFIN